MIYKINMKNGSYLQLDIIGDVDPFGAGTIYFTTFNSKGQKVACNKTEFVIGGNGDHQPYINYGLLNAFVWNGNNWQHPLIISLEEYKQEIQLVMNKWWKLRAFE